MNARREPVVDMLNETQLTGSLTGGRLGFVCPLLVGLRSRLFFAAAAATEVGEDEEEDILLNPTSSPPPVSESDKEVEKLKCCFNGEESAGIVDSDEDEEDDNEDDIMVGPAVRALAVAWGENSMICSKVAVGNDLWTKEGGVLLLR